MFVYVLVLFSVAFLLTLKSTPIVAPVVYVRLFVVVVIIVVVSFFFLFFFLFVRLFVCSLARLPYLLLLFPLVSCFGREDGFPMQRSWHLRCHVL